MCGIAGWTGPVEPDSEPTIRAMVRSIAHRGPDDQGWWVGDDAALGMSRLAIIDLAHGQQPRHAGEWTVVFNGEIYNYRALRDRLLAEGSTLSGEGDSEVVAHAIARWGSEAFAHLDGMFAIAAYHRPTRRLLLGRDRFGEKPLYLWRRGSTLAFASEPRALRHLGQMPAIDDPTLARYLALGFVPGPQTIWRDVATLPPGHFAEVTRHGATTPVRVAPIEDPRFPADPEVQRAATHSPEGPVGELDRRLRDAVASRLVADVDVGVLLSGGLDSSLVAAHAAELHPGIQSFTVRIDDPRRDESEVAAALAARLGTTHHVMTVGEREAAEVVSQLPDVYDEPFADVSAIPTLLLSRFVAGHVKVALSGDGGDELLSGYSRHDTGAIGPAERRRWIARGATRATHTWWVRPQDPWRRLQERHADPTEMYLERMGISDAAWLRELGLSGESLDPVREQVRRAQAAWPTRWAEAADAAVYLPDDLLVKVDRASMSCGLEVRAPFLSPDLASWAFGLHRDSLGPPGAKALSRELVRRRFGDDVADRPKQGFSIPVPRWLRGSLSELVDLACDGYLVRSGRLDRRGVLGLRTALSRRFDRAAAPLWAIAMFELWHQRWVDAPDRHAD